nr:phosphatidate cytidylyltransferase [Acetobacter conturbans]
MRPRLTSAAVLVVVAATAIGLGGSVYKVLITLTMTGLAMEMADMFGLARKTWRHILYLLWAACAGIVASQGHWTQLPIFPMSAFVFGPALWCGNAVIVAAGAALLWLRLGTETGIWSVVFVIAVVVSSDSSAYMVGRLIGGPKLAPSISPGKTRSGAAGGLVGAVLAGVVVAVFADADGGLSTSTLLLRSAFWAALLGVVAQTGDLIESAVKRRRGVKDSGTLLPGHGGLLDRFDALLAVAPLAALISLAAGQGAGFWAVGPDDIMAALSRWIGR